MLVRSKRAAPLLPVLGLLAACNPSPYDNTTVAPTYSGTAVTPDASASPPVLAGAFGAPSAPPPEGTAALSGGSTAPAPVAMPGAPVRMSADDIVAAFSNHTAQGITTNGSPYAVYFAPDGQERFRHGAFNDVGTWRVLPDGRLCSSLTRLSDGNQQCYIMHHSGQTITFERPDGVTVGSVRLQPGNSANL